jgi:hypothetical protein
VIGYLVGAGTLGLVWRRLSAKRGMTPERRVMYLEMLEHLSGPDAPRIFAEASERFRAEGCLTEAEVLARRSQYLSAPPEEAERRADIVRRAMQSTNAAAVRKVASWFEHWTATGVARDLRAHAAEVESGAFRPAPAAEAPKAEAPKAQDAGEKTEAA